MQKAGGSTPVLISTSEPASSSSVRETKSEVQEEVYQAVLRILEEDLSLIYDASSVHKKLRQSKPKLKSTRTQIEVNRWGR